MHRHDDKSQQRHDEPQWSDEINILSVFERFTFSIWPCELGVAREVILAQCAKAGKSITIDEPCTRDVRTIYCSDDGPNHPPPINVAIMISEVDGKDGKRTLLINNVADGFLSLIHTASNTIPGIHFVFMVSRPNLEYPGNSLRAIIHGKSVRTVYAMLDGNAWVFFEKGALLPFEDVDCYSARRKRDRLTPEIISTYLKRIGYGSLRREFWMDAAAPAHLLATPGFRLWHPSGVELQ